MDDLLIRVEGPGAEEVADDVFVLMLRLLRAMPIITGVRGPDLPPPEDRPEAQGVAFVTLRVPGALRNVANTAAVLGPLRSLARECTERICLGRDGETWLEVRESDDSTILRLLAQP